MFNLSDILNKKKIKDIPTTECVTIDQVIDSIKVRVKPSPEPPIHAGLALDRWGHVALHFKTW